MELNSLSYVAYLLPPSHDYMYYMVTSLLESWTNLFWTN